jgi:hypothetical protein
LTTATSAWLALLTLLVPALTLVLLLALAALSLRLPGLLLLSSDLWLLARLTALRLLALLATGSATPASGTSLRVAFLALLVTRLGTWLLLPALAALLLLTRLLRLILLPLALLLARLLLISWVRSSTSSASSGTWLAFIARCRLIIRLILVLVIQRILLLNDKRMLAPVESIRSMSRQSCLCVS